MLRVPLPVLSITMTLAVCFGIHPASASPHFTRQYGISCGICHSAGPKLNRTGEAFVHRGMWLPGWDDITTVDTEDKDIKLPTTVPFSFRAQTFARIRRGTHLDATTGETTSQSNYDIQAPYLASLVGGTALTQQVSFDFNAAFADRGAGSTLQFEHAVARYTGILGSLVIGQFPISDIILSRRQRLTVQDYMPFDLAGLGSERGVLANVDLQIGGLTLGATNGNGLQSTTDLNSSGIGRSDRLFDNNNSKDYFARLGLDTDVLNGGLFMMLGSRNSADASQIIASTISGADGSLVIEDKFSLFGLAMVVRWDDFIQTNIAETWYAGSLGLDYITDAGSSFSLLYNYINAGTLGTSSTPYRGLATNSITASVSHYFARNVRGIIEINTDFQPVDSARYGHTTKEDYFLTGFDITF